MNADEIMAARAAAATDVFTEDDRTMDIANWDLYEYRSIQMVEQGEVRSIVETPAYARAKATLDSLFVAERPAWHGMGNYVLEAQTADEAIILAGLEWMVERWDLIAVKWTDDGVRLEVPISSRVANIRGDTLAEMAVVGTTFQTVQNRPAFGFMDEIVASGEAHFVAAGAIDEGRKVFICLKLDRDIRIGGVDDEIIDPYLVLTNAHDGTGALRTMITPVRPACKNTVRAAKTNASVSWYARHTKNVLTRADEAREALKVSFRYYDDLQKTGDEMISRTVSNREFEKIVEQLLPMPEGKDVTDRMRDNVDIHRISLLSVAANSPNLENIRQTAWGRYNAVAEWADYMSPMRSVGGRSANERRFEKAVLSNDLPIKDRALELLTV
jgi:phage/plasmid-like protein (TIGR03299 family)